MIQFGPFSEDKDGWLGHSIRLFEYDNYCIQTSLWTAKASAVK